MDYPFLDEGGEIEDFDYTPNEHNTTSSMYGISKMMKRTKGYYNSYYYKTIKNSMGGLTNKEADSVAMRILIHLVADIHQPLHAGGRMNSDYP